MSDLTQEQKSKEQEPKASKLYLNTKKLIWIILILLISYIFALILFGFILTDKTNLLEPNAIGDMVGGLAAPFMNLIAALLVYNSFMAQVEANKKIEDQLEQNNMQIEHNKMQLKQNERDEEFRIIEKIIDELRTDLRDFQFDKSSGATALQRYGNWFSNWEFNNDINMNLEEVFVSNISYFKRLHTITYWFYDARERVENSSKLSIKDKDFFRIRIRILYHEYLLSGVQGVVNTYTRVNQLPKPPTHPLWTQNKPLLQLIEDTHQKYVD